jgi:NAD(P)-dependent dehydrogenase (short-subunit alcohol dehydrogenase family)
MTVEFKGMRALVTGSTSGIGRACACLLARDGAHVLVTGRRAELGADVVDEIRSRGGTGEYLPSDLGDPRSVDNLAAAAGAVDVLVSNGGGFTFGPSEAVTLPEYAALFDTNVRGAFFSYC